MTTKMKHKRHNPATVADLVDAANPKNPRQISEEMLAFLGDSLAEFGDLSGIIFNRRTRRLIGGHQRIKRLDHSWPIAKASATDSTGTVVSGTIQTPWCAMAYREVDWTESKEQMANLAANKIQGEWDTDLLADWMREFPEGADLRLTGFNADEISAFIGGNGGDGVRNSVSLAEQFGVPPFSVLDARQGYWQDRKRAWLALGIRSELGRGGGLTMGVSEAMRELQEPRQTYRIPTAAPGGSARPACDYSKRQRGDGLGRPIK